MMINGFANNVKATLLTTGAQQITATTTFASMDLLGCNGRVAFLLNLTVAAAVSTSNYLTFTVQESADNSTWADVTDLYRYQTPDNRSATDYNGNSLFKLTDPTLKAHVFEVSPGVNRYMRLVATETGTFDGTMVINAIFPDLKAVPYPATTNDLGNAV